MSEDQPHSPSRRRPTYGLPAPTGTGATPGSAPRGPADPMPQGSYGAADPYGTGATGDPAGATAPSAPGAPPVVPLTGSYPPAGVEPPRRRRRGVWPLVIGLILLLVVAPVAAIGGIVWGAGSIVADTTGAPVVLEGGSGEVEATGGGMIIVYVPVDAAVGAECTAEGAGGGDVTTVPATSSAPVTFGDGTQWVQVLGVGTLEDTTVSISCTGADQAGYLGPYSMTGMLGPLLLGPGIGVVAGLVGLVLAIVGIVQLIRSRRTV